MMKKLALLVPFTALMITGLSFGQAPNPPKDNDELKKLISSHSWTWERPGEQTQTISFTDKGSATNNDWVAKYTVTDLHKISMKLKNKTAKLVFSDDYLSFTGTDFNGATPVTGKAKP